MRARSGPIKAPKKVKRAYLKLSLNNWERTALERAAHIAGIAPSAWFRDRIRRVAVRGPEETGEIAALAEQGKREK